MLTKYSFNIADEAISKEFSRLVNQLWKLLPMKENGEDWEKQLVGVTVEVAGLGKIFYEEDTFLQLLAKLEGIRAEVEIPFELYRKTIFESIALLQKLRRKNGK